MSNDAAKAHRILYVKIRTLSSDATTVLASTIKSSAPFYAALGDVRMRLLRNVDDPAQFLQIIEYQTDQALELNRHNLASNPTVHNYIQAWRTLFPGGIEIDVYEDVTNSV
jgi:hypothetical protein